MKLKVAIIGCGKAADMHVEEIRKMTSVACIVAVCDRELLMAEQLAFRYNIPNYYDDVDQMLFAEEPDVVHIATPPQSHLFLAMKALEAGCHVYVEKPFTMSHAESIALVEQAMRAKRKLTVGYTYLFDPPALAMRKLIAKGVLGEPVHVESFYGYNLASAYGTALLSDANHWVHRLPGKLVHNNLDHIINKAVEFLDDDHPAVTAFSM